MSFAEIKSDKDQILNGKEQAKKKNDIVEKNKTIIARNVE
jgi:hypothetical protein